MSQIALHGGKPIRTIPLPFFRPAIDDEDIAAVTRSLRADRLTNDKLVREFEEAMAKYTGSRYAVAVSSGAAGMHIALMAGGIGPQEEVIASPLARPASTNGILYQKAAPIFADVLADDYTLDPDTVKYRLSHQTRGIIASHYAGRICRMDLISELAQSHNLLLIEDAAEALGATYQGRPAGAWGSMAVYSFGANFPLNTGEGGMVTTDSAELYQWLTMFRNAGVVTHRELLVADPGPWHTEMQDLGFNYRLTEMQAALGLSQLKKTAAALRRRTAIAETYHQQLADLPGLVLPPLDHSHQPAWNMFVVRLLPEKLMTNRREIFMALLAENIGVDVKYPPIHLQPYYLWIGHPEVCTLEGSLCPVAEEVYDQIICLPIYASLTDEDVRDVTEAVISIISYFNNNSNS